MSDSLIGVYAALRLKHINVRGVVEQYFDLLLGYVVGHGTPDGVFVTVVLLADHGPREITLLFVGGRYDSLNEAGLEQRNINGHFLKLI